MLFFVIIDKNFENLILLMSFQPEELYNTFIDVKETFLDFLLIVSEMLFASSLQTYKFDNYIFFCHTISFITEKLDFGGNVNHKVLNL